MGDLWIQFATDGAPSTATIAPGSAMAKHWPPFLTDGSDHTETLHLQTHDMGGLKLVHDLKAGDCNFWQELHMAGTATVPELGL